MGAFEEIHGVEDQQLLIEDNPESIVPGTAELPDLNAVDDVLLQLLLRHDLELFGIGNGVLDLLDFVEHLISVRGYFVLIGTKTVANSDDLVVKNVSRLDNDDVGGSRLGFVTFLLRDVESVEDRVSLRNSENHLRESFEVVGVQNAGNVEQSHLVEGHLVYLFTLLGGVEDLPCLEKQVFVIFKFTDFVGKIRKRLIEFIKSLVFGVDLFLNLVKQGQRTDILIFEILILIFKDGFNQWNFGEVELALSDLPGDEVRLLDDFLAPLDRVEVGSVEGVWNGVNELDETLVSQTGNHLVSILLGNMQMVVLHLC